MSWFAVPTAIRDHLLADPALVEKVGDNIHYQTIPDTSKPPHIWFTRQSIEKDDLLGGEDGIDQHRFTLEVVATRVLDWLDILVDRLEALEGVHNGYDIQLVEVTDADDDYMLQSVGEGDADYVHVFSIDVYLSKE